jgi:hypothetical protein
MKMLKKILAVVFLFSVVLVVCVVAQEEDNKVTPSGDTPPAGMEYLQITDGYRVLVPKGTKLIKVGSSVVPEGIRAFTARRLLELEERIIALEKNEGELKQKCDRLQQLVNDLTQQVSTLKNTPPLERK